MRAHEPVGDWATDFDHADPEYNSNVHAIWDELRERCPVAHTDRYGGAWLPVTHEHVQEIAYDTDRFTSLSVVVSNNRPGDDELEGIGGAPPITSDPPFHQFARRLLLPPFSPKRIAELEGDVRTLCRQRLDELVAVTPGETVVDAAQRYAQHIPVGVIARMLGFPAADDDLFREFVHDVLEGVDVDPAEREAAFERLDEYLTVQIDDHLENPRDDLTSYLLSAEIDGQPLERSHVAGSMLLLLIAGIDTTWSAIGSALWHLAQHPDDRRRMCDDPEVIPFAIEELLRAYAPVTMARLVRKDHDFHGCPMQKDDWVLLPFPAANRDPSVFDRPGEVVIDRAENRHAAFGLGIHRCLGSNLARLELRVAVEEFLARFPEFELADPGAVTWSVGQVRGPRQLPVRVL